MSRGPLMQPLQLLLTHHLRRHQEKTLQLQRVVQFAQISGREDRLIRAICQRQLQGGNVSALGPQQGLLDFPRQHRAGARLSGLSWGRSALFFQFRQGSPAQFVQFRHGAEGVCVRVQADFPHFEGRAAGFLQLGLHPIFVQRLAPGSLHRPSLPKDAEFPAGKPQLNGLPHPQGHFRRNGRGAMFFLPGLPGLGHLPAADGAHQRVSRQRLGTAHMFPGLPRQLHGAILPRSLQRQRVAGFHVPRKPHSALFLAGAHLYPRVIGAFRRQKRAFLHPRAIALGEAAAIENLL